MDIETEIAKLSEEDKIKFEKEVSSFIDDASICREYGLNPNNVDRNKVREIRYREIN